MNSIKYILAIMVGLFSVKVFSQDLIYKTNKEVIMVIIVEFGSDEIKYKDFNSNNQEIHSMSKSEIIKIKTEGGKEIIMSQGASYGNEHKNAVKIDMFSYLFSKVVISFEHSLRPSHSFEVQLGVIGIGKVPVEFTTLNGGFIRLGHKFIASPEYYLRNGNEAHLLKGIYARVGITLGYFKETKTYLTQAPYTGNWYRPFITVTEVRSGLLNAVGLDLGKQWVIGDNFLVDVFVGAGATASSDLPQNQYAYIVHSNGHLVLNAGFKVGALF